MQNTYLLNVLDTIKNFCPLIHNMLFMVEILLPIIFLSCFWFCPPPPQRSLPGPSEAECFLSLSITSLTAFNTLYVTLCFCVHHSQKTVKYLEGGPTSYSSLNDSCTARGFNYCRIQVLNKWINMPFDLKQITLFWWWEFSCLIDSEVWTRSVSDFRFLSWRFQTVHLSDTLMPQMYLRYCMTFFYFHFLPFCNFALDLLSSRRSCSSSF